MKKGNKSSNTLLSVQELKVYFRRNQTVARAVDGVSYDVRRGETVCLVGESGCGKTVSALTILGLIPQPPGEIVGGEVLFKGESLLELNEEEMQKISEKSFLQIFYSVQQEVEVYGIGSAREEESICA